MKRKRTAYEFFLCVDQPCKQTFVKINVPKII